MYFKKMVYISYNTAMFHVRQPEGVVEGEYDHFFSFSKEKKRIRNFNKMDNT
jgi:hypothetical protein